jgi:hypothetical protein
MRSISRARRRGDVVGGLILAALALALVGGAVLFGLRRVDPVDPETFCALRHPPAAQVVILVDSTDALEPRHRRRVEAAVRAEASRLAKGDRLTLASLSDKDPREPLILFSKCDPGDGASANPLFQNGARLDVRWRDAFGDPLAAAIARAVKGRIGEASPLTDAIRALAEDPDFTSAPEQRRRLVIASDLMEHRPGEFSLYAAGATYQSFARLQSGLRPPPDLTNVDVRLVQLDRPDREARQLDARAAFWAPYFEAAHARDVRWDP